MRNLHLRKLIEEAVREGFDRDHTVGELTETIMTVIEEQIEEETPLCPKRCPITNPVTQSEKHMSNIILGAKETLGLSCDTCGRSCKNESTCVQDHHWQWIPQQTNSKETTMHEMIDRVEKNHFTQPHDTKAAEELFGRVHKPEDMIPPRTFIVGSDKKPKGYGKCPDCIWDSVEEGCNVKRDSKQCKLNFKNKLCYVERDLKNDNS